MRIAVYPGSFDPITNGHLSVLRRISGLFDRFIFLVTVNPRKTPLFSEEQRIELIQDAVAPYRQVTVDASSVSMAAYAQSVGANWLIRGIRDMTDMTAEHRLAEMIYEVAPELTTLFVHVDEVGISSSKLKQIAEAGQPIDRYCTPRVSEALRSVIAEVKKAKV